jgi:hypothetical protein
VAGARLSPARAVLIGTLTVAVLDGLDAVVFFGLRGVPPTRIFQAIASGLLGRAAFAGGPATVLLGVALHFVVACGIVTTYVVASRYLTALARRPFVFGPLYGVAAYLVMNFVVIPLSAVTPGPRAWPVVANGVLIHILGVGLPAALFARAARARTPAGQLR